MPVSPRDFELYSRMTGAPMPSDPMSRMQMAPAVYDFTKNFARKPNLLEKTGNLAKTVGKIGLMGLGVGFKQSQANEQRAIQEQLREQSEARQAESRVTGDSEEPKVEREKTPAEIIEDKRMARLERTSELKQQERDDKQQKAMDLLKAKKENLVDTPTKESYTRTKMIMTDPPQYEEELIDPFPQQPTTADAYSQDRVENQTSIGLIDKKNEQAAELTTDNTVAEVLSESQDSIPQEAYTDKFGLEQIGSGDITSKTDKFLDKVKTDPLLALAFSQRDKKEELVDDSSILSDNVDSATDGGEDMSNIPGQNNHRSSGTNTGATVNLNQRKQEIEETVRKGLGTLSQKQQEKVVESMMSPSNKQVNLLQQREIDNEDAIKSGFMNLDDEGRKKESIRLGSNFGIPNKTDMQEIRKDPEFIAAQESMKPKSLSEKVDNFKAKFVEGSRSDIVRGQRGNQSLGITRIPATNGDSQVGFVLANRPIDQSPTTATTYGFGVAPGAEGMLDNQLQESSFDLYMDRGMSEARQGKKRKAGEIFEFLSPSKRVVQGKASLGDIVM